MNKLYWKTRILIMSLRWIFRTNIGDVVWYKGRKYEVCNGARCGCWRLDFDNGADGWVRRSDCKKVWSVSNVRHSFFSGWNFYMGYWYDIWCRDGIKPWMRACNIWPRDKHKEASHEG